MGSDGRKGQVEEGAQDPGLRRPDRVLRWHLSPCSYLGPLRPPPGISSAVLWYLLGDALWFLFLGFC